MKPTKVHFEHHLNNQGNIILTRLNQGELAGMDDYYETWRKSKSIRRYGQYLRKNYPQEFNKRYQSWINFK